jgi:tetratricopeptide (TPR) repeat protein
MLKIKDCLILLLIACSFSAFSQNATDADIAKQFYDTGQYDKAYTLYKSLYQSKNGSDIYYQAYLNVLIKLKQYPEAEKIILKKAKENPKTLFDLGQLYQEKGDLAAADKVFENIIQKMEPNQFAIADVANSFYAINNYDYAIKTFIEGRKIIKEDYAFVFELINLYRFKKMKNALTSESLKILDQQPELLAMVKSNLSRTYENDEDYEVLRSLLLKKIQKDAQNTTLIDLLAWQYIQQKQFNLALIQYIALDRRTEGNGSKVFSLAGILEENGAFETANKAYNYLIDKGNKSPYYIASRVANLKNKGKQLLTGNYTSEQISGVVLGYEALLTEYGSNTQTVFAIRELANLKAYYQNDLNRGQKLLEDVLSFPSLNPLTLASVKLELANIYILNNERWEAALLYGQIEKSLSNEPIAQEAKFKNAKLSFYNGDFTWAKAQLDVLKASTSQLIANDALDLSLLLQENLAFDSTGNALKMYAKADLYRFTNMPDKALSVLDSLAIYYPQTDLLDDVAMMKGEIFINKNNYTKAAEIFKSLITQFPYSIWIDDAYFKLATLEEEHLNDKISAQKHYEELLQKYPGSLYVIDARKRFRNLRGDAL